MISALATLFSAFFKGRRSKTSHLSCVRGHPSEDTRTTPSHSAAREHLAITGMWGVSPSDRWDWATLKEAVKQYGVRNSLLVAPMPTASTLQMFGNNECFEPYTSNIYTIRVLSGEFIIVNKHLLKDLVNLGLWNNNMKNRIIAANGLFSTLKKYRQT